MLNKIVASGIQVSEPTVLGINGNGRIGKLALWNHSARKTFDIIVINIGREVGAKGQTMNALAQYTEKDTTYGRLANYIGGYFGETVITDVNESEGSMVVNGTKVIYLREARTPNQIDWRSEGVRLVLDTTGVFLNPLLEEQDPKALRGHMVGGAEKIIASAPFKGLNGPRDLPSDAVMTVMGINDNDYRPDQHSIISNASCTTTCLSHMIKPVINYFGIERLLTASMATVHAATGSQQVLDKLQGAGKADLRKNRSILNNIILTSTGAAKALSFVIPEMASVGFLAESVRVPTLTGSLVILSLNLQPRKGQDINKTLINDIYKDAAEIDPKKYLQYSESQHVSSDFIGFPKVAAQIEGYETHTRTAEMKVDLSEVPGFPQEALDQLSDPVIKTPFTQAVVYGWYDNEDGSYSNVLADRVISVAEGM